MRFAEVLELILRELDSGNIDCFYLDGQTVILEDYFQLYPENIGNIIDLIKQNKIIIGPWYTLADEFLVSGESLYRNLLYGINQAKDFGCEKFIGYLPDSFGHNSEIPRILNSFGIKNAVLWRGAGEQKSEFNWKSQDGSSVLATYLTEGYFQDLLHSDTSIEEKSKNLKGFLDKIKKFSSADYLLLPIGADHLGPLLNCNNIIKKIDKCIEGYSFEYGGIFDYLEKVKDAKYSDYIGELRDNSRNPILPGTLSTRLYLKQANAVAAWKLSKLAEPFYSLLQNLGMAKRKDNEIKQAWKILIKNHAHDSICGCSIDAVHREMLPRFEQVNQISEWLISKGRNEVSKRVRLGEMWIYNASDYKYTGVVKVKSSLGFPDSLQRQLLKTSKEFPESILMNTQKVPVSEDMEDFKEYLVYAENIPPHSLKLLTERSVADTAKVIITEKSLENSLVKLEITPYGLIKLKDLTLNKEFEGLHSITDRADIGDTYNFSPAECGVPLKAKLLKTEIVEKGDLRSILRLHYELKNTLILTDISLCAGSKRIEFNTSWENRNENHILQVGFKLKEKITKTFSENTFGVMERDFEPDYRIEDYIPAKKGKELKTNTASMQRFVWSQGLGIITEGLPEYEVYKNRLSITILRSIGMLSKLNINTRAFPAGPPLETPEAQCLGKQSARYAICAIEKPEDLFKQADEFYGSLISGVGYASQTEKIQETFLNIENPNIYTYAIKPSEDKSGIVARLMNLSGVEQKIMLDCGAEEVNGLEKIIDSVSQEIIFKPYELKNLLFKKESKNES